MSADWLAPPKGSLSLAQAGALADFGLDLIAVLRHRLGDPGHPAPGEQSPEYADAFYAWGVSCYETGRYADSAVIFDYLDRLQPASLRCQVALGANHLMRGDFAASARCYQLAHGLAGTDAQILFFWGQAALLQSDPALARHCVGQALTMALTHPARWPELADWCRELEALIDAAIGPEPPADRFFENRVSLSP